MKKYIFFLYVLFIAISFLGGVTVNVGPSRTYTTISSAVAAYPPGSVLDIVVDPGIYTDNIDDPTKKISITGSGNGDNPLTDTIIKKSSDNPIFRIYLTGTPTERVVFRNFRIVPEGIYAFEFPDSTSVSYITFENLTVTGDPAAWGENEIGIKVSTTANVDNIEILDSVFSHLDYALYFAKHGDWGPGTSNVTNFSMRNCSIIRNDYKGAYIEKLSDALFDNVTVNYNGHTDFWNSRWNAGIDINLKGDNYQNISFTGSVFQNNAQSFRDGAALMIKARDDGATYGAHPATLSNVTISNCEFRNNERGIRFGEPERNNAGPSNVTVIDSTITGNVQTYAGNDGSEYGGVINYTQVQTDARYNFWDADCTGPYHATLNPTGQGDTVYGDVIFTPWRCYSSPVAIIDTIPDPPVGIVPLQITFDGSSSHDPVGTITSYLWDFGDGNISADPVVKHTYYNNGKYRVTLTVTNNLGITDSAETTISALNSGNITAKIWTRESRIKSDGKATTLIYAQLLSGGFILKNRYRISFMPGTGTVEGPVSFDNRTAVYSQILRSGPAGTDTIQLFINGYNPARTSIEYIRIQPPANFSLTIHDDSKIFVKHYVAELNWSPPIISYPEIKLQSYRIYRSFDRILWTPVAEPDLNQDSYLDSISSTPVYYSIVSVDSEGDESIKSEAETK